MERVDKNDSAAGEIRDASASPEGQFAGSASDSTSALVGNERFAFRTIDFGDIEVSGAQVAQAYGAQPLKEFTVIAQLSNFAMETLRPNEHVKIGKVMRFFVIKGGSTNRFSVNELSLEWPKNVITGLAIKRLIGKEDDDIELIQLLDGEAARVVDEEDDIRIGGRGTETFKTRSNETHVKIVVNAREKSWNAKKIAFAQLVALAYVTPPAGQCIVYTVTFHNGPRANPEGTMVEGEKVKVKDGMVFNVQYTDKS